MINDWINRNDIEKSDALLLFIYFLRAATVKQLAALLNLEEKSVVQYICRLNKTKRMVQTHHLGKRGERIYTLLQKGVDVVVEILGKATYYPVSKRQGRHWRGLNDIVLRIIQVLGLNTFADGIIWYNASQARIFLLEEWRKKKGQEEYRNMLSPDSRLDIKGKIFCWIEYDHDSEGKQMIWDKYKEYIHRLSKIDNDDPVFWICPTEKRKEQLKRWWKEFSQEQTEKPETQMQFFVEGNETEIIVRNYKKFA